MIRHRLRMSTTSILLRQRRQGFRRAVYERQIEKKTTAGRASVPHGWGGLSVAAVIRHLLSQPTKPEDGHGRGAQHACPPGQPKTDRQGAKAECGGARKQRVGQLCADVLNMITAR